ncbi:MAG: DMT family transporter [Propioniciclava sp.]|uniref:DMT family transporter n=1 Tax=Propioniciclava sp. TaxID=2038686 RepID=UPI0039E2A43B
MPAHGRLVAPDSSVTGGRIALYALMVTIWGSSFFFTSLALRSFNPLLLVELRLILAGAVLGLFVMMARRSLPRTWVMWWHFIVLGAIGIALPLSLLTWAQVWVPSSMAIVLSSTTPVFVFLISAVILKKERFRLTKMLGISLCFGGVVLLTFDGGGFEGSVIWPIVVVVASAIYAIANVYVRVFVSHVDPMVVAFLQMSFGALWMIPVTTLTGSWVIDAVGPISVVALLELGILGSGFAYVLFFFFIRTWGSTATSLNTYLQPVVGVLLGVAVLGERMSSASWVALGVIVLGIGTFGWTSLRDRRGRLPTRTGS